MNTTTKSKSEVETLNLKAKFLVDLAPEPRQKWAEVFESAGW